MNIYRNGKKISEVPEETPGWKEPYYWAKCRRFTGFSVETSGEGDVAVLPLYYTPFSLNWAKGILFITISSARRKTYMLVLATHAPFVQLDLGKNNKARKRYDSYVDFWNKAIDAMDEEKDERS